MAAPQTRHQIVLCTCPDETVARELAGTLVRGRLAACVNIIDRVTSVYEWEGNIETDGEVLLVIKSRADHFDALHDAIVTGHPYELPEIIAVAVDSGSAGYLEWIDQCLTPS